jgi:hypothetical protein
MGTGTVLVAVNGKKDDVKSALSVRVPFCAVCAFFGMAPLHVGPPMLQFGHPFPKGFDRIHGCLLYQIVEMIYSLVAGGGTLFHCAGNWTT